MQSFRFLARARAALAAPAAGRAGPWAVGLALVAVSAAAAVLAGLALAPRPRAGPPARPAVAVEPSPAAAGSVAAGSAAAAGSPAAAAGSPAAAVSPGAAAGAGPDWGAAGPGGGAWSGAAARAELTRRLGEILQLRERAYARRDATVLETIYTADCACLRGGRAAIARLLADHAVWRGRSVSVRVERLSRVNDSLWIALAVLRRGAFWIEGEDGTLRSAEPATRQRYRFALARTGTGAWLLAHASLVEELPP